MVVGVGLRRRGRTASVCEDAEQVEAGVLSRRCVEPLGRVRSSSAELIVSQR